MEKVKRYAGVLVKYNDKVLLCKRSPHQTLPGVWSIPAGSVEKDETPKEGAMREFFEETNYVVLDEKDLKLVGTVNRYARDNKYIKGVMYVYMYEVDEPIYPDLENAMDGHEHTECDYFSYHDLPFEDHKDQLFRLILKIF